ncbi:MAG: LptF/LptG family permease [Chlamydiae bacterium]|nr:LptF/LptG family permease [Chlamydiota bacterium]
MILKTWQRYLFKEILKVFFFFIFCFYLIYILIDYSLHASHFSKMHHLHVADIGTYYFYLIIKRLDITLPLALIITTNKVLLKLNQTHELIALTVGGLSRRQILFPFFTLATCISLLLFFNAEQGLPGALDYLENFENLHFKKKTQKNYNKRGAYALALPEGGKLIFALYNAANQTFEDVFYIKNPHDIWKMKSLHLHPPYPEGLYVEHLVKTPSKGLTLDSSYEKKVFSDLVVDFTIRKKATLSFEGASLSSLFSLFLHKPPLYYLQKAPILTHLYLKALTPFISFLTLYALAPFCMIFSRKLKIFILYAMSIFGLVLFFIVLDAAVILGENQKLAPLVAIATPFVLGILGCGRIFTKKHTN